MEIRDVYTSWLESKSENTRTKYQAKVDNFSEMVFGKEAWELTEEDLVNLTYHDVYGKYIKTFLTGSKPTKETTIVNYLRSIKSYFGAIRRAGIYPNVNFDHLVDDVLYTKDLSAKDGGHNEQISKVEVKEMESWLIDNKPNGYKYATLIDFMFHTAVRVSATFTIRWSDFTVYESPYGGTFAKLKVIDKGRKLNDKDIPVEHFNNLKETMGYDGNDDELVFKGMKQTTLRNYMKEFSDLNGRNWTPYSLKVGAATTFYSITKDIVATSRLLDHESLDTTISYIRNNPNPNDSGTTILYSSDTHIDFSKLKKEQLLMLINNRPEVADMLSRDAARMGVN